MSVDNVRINFDINQSELNQAIRNLSVADKRAVKLYAELYKLGKLNMNQIPAQFREIIRSVDTTTRNLNAGDRATVQLYRDLVQVGDIDLSDVPEEFRDLVGEIEHAEEATESFSVRLRRGMQQAADTMKKVGSAMMDVGRTMTETVTKPIIQGLGFAIKKNIEFEQQLSSTGAISGATAREMAKLKDQALQLGKDTKYSALEAAQGQEELLKAGRNINQVFTEMADVLNMAAAGDLEIARSAEIGSNVVNMFAKQGIKMSQVADIMAGAANASAIDIEEFYTSLSYVGPVAASLGISLQDVSNAIGVLGNNAIKGDKAGTGLRQFLMRLQPASDKAAKNMKELGLITEDGGNKFYTASGKIKSLGEVVSILRESLKGLTDKEKQEKLKNIFGLIASPTVLSLLNSEASAMDDMSKAIKKVGAEEVAAKRMDNFAGTIERVQGSIETFAIKIGDILAPTLKSFADKLDNLLGFIIDIPKPFLKWGIAIGLVVAAIGPLILAAGALISAGGTIIGALSGISLPVVGIVAGISALVIGLGILGTALIKAKFGSFKNALEALQETIKKFDISAKFESLKTTISNFVAFITPYILKAKNIIMDNLKNIDFSNLIQSIKGIWENLKIMFEVSKPLLKLFAKDVIIQASIMIAAIGPLINTIKNIATVFIEVGNILRNAVALQVALFTGDFSKIKGIVSNILNSVKNIFKTAIKNIYESNAMFINNLLRLFTAGKFHGLPTTVGGVLNKVKSRFTQIMSSIKESVRKGLEYISEKFSKLKIKFPKIPMPHFKVTGSFDLKKLTVPKLSISFYKSGTNFATGGLSLVGENGPELINLPRGSQVYNNTKTNNILSNSNRNVTINYSGNTGTSDRNSFTNMLRMAGVS